MLEEEIRLGGK